METRNAADVLLRKEQTIYDYDHTGIRVSVLHEVDSSGDGAWDQRTRTDYLNDPHNHTGYSQVLRETYFDASTGLLQKRIDYTLGLDEIAQTTTTYDAAGKVVSRETLVFGHDGHGNVRVLFDLAGAIAQLYVYEAYGQLAAIYNAAGQFLSANPADARTTILDDGEPFDNRIGWGYRRARWVDPHTGRFNGFDPFFGDLWDPQSFHKYLFTHADPINGTDPTGAFVSMLASAGIYGVAEVTWTVVTGAVITTALLTGGRAGFLLREAGLVLVADGEFDFGFFLYNLGVQIVAFTFEVIDGLDTVIGLGVLTGTLIWAGIALARKAPGLANEILGLGKTLIRKRANGTSQWRGAVQFTHMGHWQPPAPGSLQANAAADHHLDLIDRFDGMIRWVDDAPIHPDTGRRIYGTYDPATNTITFYKDADWTTSFHELLHWEDVTERMQKFGITRQQIQAWKQQGGGTWQTFLDMGEQNAYQQMIDWGFTPVRP